MSELTVGDLVAMRQLGCLVLAGSEGLDRTVIWAHTCELEDPWNWLAKDELLMTTGMCIPAAEEKQVLLIRRLTDAGVAGLAVGDDMQAPPLTDALFAEADQLGLPVIMVSHSTPFSAIGRTVAVASQSEQISRIARLSRLYEAVRATSISESTVLERLSTELGLRLHVVDVVYGTEVLSRKEQIDPETMRALCRHAPGRADRLPTRIAVEVNGVRAGTGFSLPTHRACMLVVVGSEDVDVDAFGLLHAQSLIGIEIERLTRERERNDAAGATLFEQLTDGTLGSDAAQPRLEHAGLGGRTWAILAFDSAYLKAARVVLGDHGTTNLSCVVGEESYVMLEAQQTGDAAAVLERHIPHMGLSNATSTLQRLPDHVRQARWALQAARADGSAIAEYSTAAPLFLPRTLTDAHFAARAVLGELIDHDEKTQARLVDTLETYLTSDRSWSVTADKLMIHRQTLAYRLKKIEAITGRSTKSSADIASLWMALIARRISQGEKP